MVTDAEIVEAHALPPLEDEPKRAMVPVQPGQAIVSVGATGPTDMLAQATVIATALSAMVERQKLFTLISGKKYPQVEAWMTIGRMDNVVAREAGKPIQLEDGAWEAEVELIRLSDGMVIGRASAMCGAKGDRPWDSRPDHQRRSMSVTRATSRAFRQQYSWIMALAGYEPTPADEMPHEDRAPARDGGFVYGEPPSVTHDGLIGTAEAGKGDADFELRQSTEDGLDGFVLCFRLTNGKKGWKVMARNELALQLADARTSVEGQRVTVWGRFEDESFTNKAGREITYQIVHATKVQTPTATLPEQAVVDANPTGVSPVRGQTGFDLVESARLDAEEAAAG